MPAYNFKRRFRPMVLDGSKRHTIRAERKQVQRVGDPCYLYCGMRTSSCEFLLAAPCLKVEPLIIPELNILIVAGLELTDDECERLAWCDGFRPELETDPALRKLDAFQVMMRFWAEEHIARGRMFPFRGNLIHWDYDRRLTDRTAAKRLVVEVRAARV